MKADPVNAIVSKTDPVYHMIYRITRHRPILAALLLSLALGLPMVLAALWEGGFVSSALRMDMAHDLGLWVSLAVVPIFLLYSRSLYNRFPMTLEGLFANRVITTDELNFRSAITRWYELLGSRALTVIIYSIFLGVFLIQTEQGHLNRNNAWAWPDTWHSLTPSAFLSFPVFALSLYLAVQLAMRLALICFFIVRVCTVFTIRVYILHPDRSGGLAPLGKLAMHLNLLVLISSLIVVATLYNQVFLFKQSIYAPLQLVTILGHFLFSALIVFTPMIAAHRKMTKARDAFLGMLSVKFLREDQDFRSALESEASIDIGNVQRLNAIKTFFDTAKTQPVWPFNMKVIYTFFGSVIWPLVFSILKDYVAKVLYLFK